MGKRSGGEPVRSVLPEKALFAAAAGAAAIAGVLLLSSFLSDSGLRCSFLPTIARTSDPTSELAEALLYYATTPVVPQQSRAEIRLAFDVLRRRSPCNFLVFGLGRDSQLWSALNPGGTTLFLEEDPQWYSTVLKSTPWLKAHHVKYRTQLSEAEELMRSYRAGEGECRPSAGAKGLQRNDRCKLALVGMPGAVYDREWDVVMIDAPKGYFPKAPGRMGAIYTVAVMARGRRGAGETDVFLHDVDRPVEKKYAMEFLCDKYRAGGAGRLWHFRIPPVNVTSVDFCWHLFHFCCGFFSLHFLLYDFLK